MKRYLSILLILATAMTAMADYSVKSITGNVKLLKHGRTLPLKTGDIIDPEKVMILIDTDSELVVCRTTDNKLYTFNTPVLERLSRMVFLADREAGSNIGAVNSKLRLKREKESEGVVHVEKGKVTRSLSIYDPEGQGCQMDADKMASRLYVLLRDSLDSPSAAQTLALSRRIDPNGLSFMVENTLEHPIYFNVFKISASDGSVSISELGQPVGCYAILPTQFLAREQTSGLNEAELHIMIMSDFYFDIDAILARLNTLLDKKAEVESNANISLYILPL